MKFDLRIACTILALATVASAAAINEPPPAGAILDLNGQPVPNQGSYQQYTVDFTAAVANTAITFAFREDPAFISFEDASLVDLTTASSNLLTNGDFSGGVYSNNGNDNTPNGWTYANIYGASFGGGVSSSSCVAGGPTANCWYDGAVQAYDAISQTVGTNIGDNYEISFYVSDNGPNGTFSSLSTNGDTTDTGGNGVDVLAYAQDGLPAPGVPEPATYGLVGLGSVGLGVFRALRNRKA